MTRRYTPLGDGREAKVATQAEMTKGLRCKYEELNVPIEILLTKGAMFTLSYGAERRYALVYNSPEWGRHNVAMGVLEDRGQCNGVTKAGHQCKKGIDTAQAIYIAWKHQDKWYCKQHAPEGAVHVKVSSWKVRKAKEENDERIRNTPEVIHRTRREADQAKLRTIYAAAKAAGLVKPRLMTIPEWNKHLKDLDRKGELGVDEGDFGLLTINEPSPPPTPEPVVEEPVVEEPTVQARDVTIVGVQDGVWIEGIKYVPDGLADVDTSEVIRQLEEDCDNSTVRIQRAEKDRDDLMTRLNEVEAAIVAYCDGETTLKELRGVLLDG